MDWDLYGMVSSGISGDGSGGARDATLLGANGQGHVAGALVATASEDLDHRGTGSGACSQNEGLGAGIGSVGTGRRIRAVEDYHPDDFRVDSMEEAQDDPGTAPSTPDGIQLDRRHSGSQADSGGLMPPQASGLRPIAARNARSTNSSGAKAGAPCTKFS